jgi:hypothetical protein
MIDLLNASVDIFTQAKFKTLRNKFDLQEVVLFEDDTILGFLFAYDTLKELIENWETDMNGIVTANQFGLRRAAQKAWNTYAIFLTREQANYAGISTLSGIEENLAGTRKIARAGIVDNTNLEAALLSLLPIQSAPILEAVDFVAEIRHRTPELDGRAFEAFASSVDASIVLQAFEEAS